MGFEIVYRLLKLAKSSLSYRPKPDRHSIGVIEIWKFLTQLFPIFPQFFANSIPIPIPVSLQLAYSKCKAVLVYANCNIWDGFRAHIIPLGQYNYWLVPLGLLKNCYFQLRENPFQFWGNLWNKLVIQFSIKILLIDSRIPLYVLCLPHSPLYL